MPDRPNILLILTDQQRWDSLGCYGIPGVHTPNLDRLAREGIRYDRCYVNNPVCTPSRASLWTGKHLPGHGVYALHDCLPADEILFPHRLREAGYDTALFGKLHVAGHMYEKDRRHTHDGFNTYEWTPDPNGYQGHDNAYWRFLAAHHPDVLDRIKTHRGNVGHLPVEAHLTTWSAGRTIDYLTHMRGAHRPFFCCMSVFDPHNPYTNYPREYRDRLDTNALPPLIAYDEPFQGRPLAHRLEHDKGNAPFPGPEQLREIRIGYHAAVALIDHQVGRVLDALAESGFAESTLVLFASDHGDTLGDHGLITKGCYFYDACTRVPLLIRAPGAPPGEVVAAPCQPHDIAATALAAAGYADADIATWMPDARNLLDTPVLESRGYAACIYRNSGVCADRKTGYKGYFDPPLYATMWWDGHYKLTHYHAPAPAPGHVPGELFDLHADPDETHNLWDTPGYAAVQNRLMQDLLNWVVLQDARGRARGPQALPEGFGRRSA